MARRVHLCPSRCNATHRGSRPPRPTWSQWATSQLCWQSQTCPRIEKQGGKKNNSENSNPFSQSPRCPLYICHLYIREIPSGSQVSQHGRSLTGSPEQLRRPDSQTMCSKVKPGEKIPLNHYWGSPAQKAGALKPTNWK